MSHQVTKGWKTIACSGQSDVVADESKDTLTLVAGSNITITTNASADSVTITSSGGGGGGGSSTLSGLTDTTVSNPASGHILVYDGSNSFDNVAVSGDATIAANGAVTVWSSGTATLAHSNAVFDLGTNVYSAKLSTITGITIPAGAIVTDVTLEVTEAFTLNSGTAYGEAAIKIDGIWYAVKFSAESYGYISDSHYWIQNHTVSGHKSALQTIGSSSVNPQINVKSVTNDTANSGGYLTDGTLVLKVYWR